MKKTYLFLCLILAIAMSACGSSSSTETEAATTAAETEAAETSAAAESTEAAETEAAAASDAVVLEMDTPMQIGDSELTIHMEDSEGDCPMTLTYGDAEVQVTDFVEYPTVSYVLTEDDGSFLVYVGCGYSNDWDETYPVTWTSADGLKVGNMMDGCVDDEYPITAENVTLLTRVDVLGTYSCTTGAHMEDGSLVYTDNYFDFHNVADDTLWAGYEDCDEDTLEYVRQIYAEDGRQILTVTSDFTAKAADGSDVTVAAGDVIYPEGVDFANDTFCFTYNDQACTLAIAESDGMYMLAEGDENEMFALLPYAG